LGAAQLFARLGHIARLGFPQLPPDASIAETNFSRLLRVIERAGASFVGLGFFGLIALAGTPRSLQNRMGSAAVTWSAVVAAPAVSPSVLAPQGMRYQYPYSVIPGGVSSIDELREAIGSDPEVAEHLADFDFTRAQMVKLDRDSAYFVSYRLESGVFWTTERIVIRRGEILVTDGTSFLRARSGSRLSSVPCLPVTSLEPTALEMNAADLTTAPAR
jgi:hypothetical protein